jgi:hypothetical protein
MIETYSHARIEAKAEAVELLGKSGHKAPERSIAKPAIQIAATQPSIPDMTHPLIQAEINHSNRDQDHIVTVERRSTASSHLPQ